MSSSLRLRLPTAHEYFASLVAEDEGLNLLEAAASIAQDDFPQLDVQSVLSEVDELALRLDRRLPQDAAPAHRLRLLNRFFHAELGFAGNVNDYYERGNSHVHQVLATRRGIPITLAVIYLELAAQIGLQASGISFPGHFLLKVRLPQGEVVLDPLSGETLSRQALEEALLPYRAAQAAAQALLPLGYFLRDASPRQIQARMLRNLKEIHRSQADWPRLLAAQQRLVLLLPEEAAERRDRAQALLALGHWRAARADLEFYLAMSPAAPDHVAVQAQLAELRQRDGPGPC